MANIDHPFGLKPISHCPRVTKYRITASYATSLFIGTPVAKVAAGTVEIATAGTANPIVGPIVGFEEKSGKHITGQGYFLGGDTGEWYALVADDPSERFLIQEDGAVTPVALADRANSANLVATGAGSTVTNLSGWELDSSDAAGAFAAADQLIIVDFYDDPTNELGAHGKWIVQINNHQNAPGIVGVGL